MRSNIATVVQFSLLMACWFAASKSGLDSTSYAWGQVAGCVVTLIYCAIKGKE